MNKLKIPGVKFPEKIIKAFIQMALIEDLGDGDHTSYATIPASKKGQARLLVKDNGILAGVELAKQIFSEVDPKLKLKVYKKDGSRVKKGDVAFVVQGNSRSIVIAERLVLNCMQRMSGIATKTNELAGLCKGTKAKLLDTRKTTPGFRLFEKWAVQIGGGHNHRFGLYDMILIKDNHVDFAGGISPAILAAKDYLKKNKKKLKIEVEVRSLDEVNEVLELNTKIDRVLLDNFTPSQMRLAVELIDNTIETEASGGITDKNIKSYAQTGVNYISVGALTHSIKSLDLSLKAF